MGLFNMFKSDKGEKMTPHLAFATALIYMTGADGEMDDEEVGALLQVLGGKKQGDVVVVGGNNREMFDRAWRYARTAPLDTFIREAAPVLTHAQKICILMNLVDTSLADGEAEPQEQEMFYKIMSGFGISEQDFAPFFKAVLTLNDRSVFTNQNHPSNQPGVTVKLT